METYVSLSILLDGFSFHRATMVTVSVREVEIDEKGEAMPELHVCCTGPFSVLDA